MAGQPLGAQTPLFTALAPAPQRTLHRVLASSRTRRNHGVFLIGDELATVYSSRRASGGRGVSMSVGAGALVLTGTMSATQARAMACALIAAASAADAQGAPA